MSRKRHRESPTLVSPEGDSAGIIAPSASPSPPPTPAEESHDNSNFGSFLWNDVSIILFYRVMQEAHAACLAMAKASPNSRPGCVTALASSMNTIWIVAMRHLTDETEEERAVTEIKFRSYATLFIEALGSCVAAMASSGTVAFCRCVLRLLEEHGFPEAEFGPLASYSADVFLEGDKQGYSYSERTSFVMPMPPRYEGERRGEEDQTRRRCGFEVELPVPHPHPEVNTQVQLSEPKKRKPALDEYRIFSLPKKAATFAADDFTVDDELLHRSYVVLATHLDAYGSLRNLTPYARLLLWNLLERNDTVFDAIYDKAVGSEPMRQQILKLRERLAVHKIAFEETRAAARGAASLVGWYATSAQWRDQALSKLEELEDSDWYLLADTYKSGGKAVFPNYALSSFTTHLALGALRKLDRLHGQELGGAPPMHAVATRLLLPFLQGTTPEWTAASSLQGGSTVDNPCGQRRSRRLKNVMEELSGPATPLQAATRTGDRVCAYLCSSLIFPLQCLGELLELCALAHFSSNGFEAFTRSFLSSNWVDEETILAYLLRREPLNPSLVPLVGIPRLYNDMVTSVQLLMADKMVPAVVEARRLAGEGSHAMLHEQNYAYWKALSTTFNEEERFDDLYLLRVTTKVGASCLFTTAEFERMAKVWPQELQELQAEEAQEMTRKGAFHHPLSHPSTGVP